MGFHSQESNQRSLSDEASMKMPDMSSRQGKTPPWGTEPPLTS